MNADTVLVADASTDQILKFTREGDLQGYVRNRRLPSDTPARVEIVDLVSGEYVQSFQKKEEGHSKRGTGNDFLSLDNPTSVKVSGLNVYVAHGGNRQEKTNTQISEFTLQGVFVRSLTTEHAFRAGQMAVVLDKVFVLDATKKVVCVYDQNGALLWCIAAETPTSLRRIKLEYDTVQTRPEQEMHFSPKALTVADGQLFVASDTPTLVTVIQ